MDSPDKGPSFTILPLVYSGQSLPWEFWSLNLNHFVPLGVPDLLVSELSFSRDFLSGWLWAVYSYLFLNPLHAKFFRRNINICLQFMSFLRNDMTQVVEILLQVRQGPNHFIYWILWLLMSWDARSQGISNHDIDLVKPRYWLHNLWDVSTHFCLNFELPLTYWPLGDFNLILGR